MCSTDINLKYFKYSLITLVNLSQSSAEISIYWESKVDNQSQPHNDLLSFTKLLPYCSTFIRAKLTSPRNASNVV